MVLPNIGLAASVVDGGVRDLAETRERGFPVFARGVGLIVSF